VSSVASGFVPFRARLGVAVARVRLLLAGLDCCRVCRERSTVGAAVTASAP